MDSLVFFLGLDWAWQFVREENDNISQPDENHSKSTYNYKHFEFVTLTSIAKPEEKIKTSYPITSSLRFSACLSVLCRFRASCSSDGVGGPPVYLSCLLPCPEA